MQLELRKSTFIRIRLYLINVLYNIVVCNNIDCSTVVVVLIKKDYSN